METKIFETTIEKFRLYFRKMRSEKSSNFNHDLAGEVEKRLKQLDYLYKVIEEKHSRYWDLYWKEDLYVKTLRKQLGLKPNSPFTYPRTNESYEMEKLFFEIELHTETFYYIAHRIWKIAESKKEPLPGLKSFKCIGVRNVRNQLLEHPEGSGLLAQSFMVGGEQGPTLKPDPQNEQDKFTDKGLEANALEFRTNLERLLDSVISQTSSK